MGDAERERKRGEKKTKDIEEERSARGREKRTAGRFARAQEISFRAIGRGRVA